MTNDVFGAPAPRAVRGKGKGQAYIDPAGIRRDRWGRPILPHPRTGEVRPWTSVTTLAGTLSDRYALGQWQMRMVARGMGIRHDLAAMAAGVDMANPDGAKTQLQSIANDALEAAGASVGRNMGNALHDVTEEFDLASLTARIDIVRKLRPDIAGSIKAYAQAMHAHGLETVPHLIERMTFCVATESAGTFDRFVRCSDGVLRVADVKTGQHADEYGFDQLASQLAQYANGEAIWRVLDDATGEGVWEPFPESVDTSMGILIWLPAGGRDGMPHCEIKLVNLNEGMHEALTSVRVRARRKLAAGWVVPMATTAGPESVPLSRRTAPPAVPPFCAGGCSEGCVHTQGVTTPPADGAVIRPDGAPGYVLSTGEQAVSEVLAMPTTGVAGMIRDSLLSAADDAGVLDATPEELAAAVREAGAYDLAYDASQNPRLQFVESGHAGCIECLEPNEDPMPWCDCRDDERCPDGRSCRRRAHPVDRCPVRTAGGPDHYAAQKDQAAAYGPTDVERARLETLDGLLITRIAGATLAQLGEFAANPPPGWTPAHQAAAAQRWNELQTINESNA